jgi:hypothetical protein
MEGKYFGLVYMLIVFETRSMILCQYLHVTRMFRVFIVVLHLYLTQTCFPQPSVQQSVVCMCKQALLTCRHVLAPSSPSVCGWRFLRVFVIVLMVGGLWVRARGIHAPLLATPCVHFSQPVLFCYCYSFLSLCYVVTLAACHGRF